MNAWFQKQWAGYTVWHIVLIPFSWLFFIISSFRRVLYRIGLLKSTHLNVPVIVVGNITVGGTGKTPFVIWLAEQLKLAGFTPGIISRGYGGKVNVVTAVSGDSNPVQVGDEPVVIARRTNCPMFVGANRVAAGVALLKENPSCDVIISDDGLQHYALRRDVEIALVSSNNGFGNRQLLPAGPMRETLDRLNTVDFVVDGGRHLGLNNPILDGNIEVYRTQTHGNQFKSLDDAQMSQPASNFLHKKLVAIAGIGNPERFFNLLTSFGLQFERHVFPDHHLFNEQDLRPFAARTILMTEKDAVKCSALSVKDAWYLPITVTVDDINQVSLIQLILNKLRN